MRPGTFLFDPNFRFEDGSTGRKLFVVLSSGSDGEYLVAKMTSNGSRYGITHGCQPMDRLPNYYFVRGSCFLETCTWVQLHVFYPFDVGKLHNDITIGRINQIGVLPEGQTEELLICCTHSDDLAGYQEDQIQEGLAQIRSLLKASASV